MILYIIMNINIFLLIALLLSALWTVMTIRLLRAVVGLALTSAILSILMFSLNSPLAAVFELSVCAGLILVIFITTISFTQRITHDRLLIRKKERFAKFWALPLIIIAVGILLIQLKVVLGINLPEPLAEHDVRKVLWNIRHLDLLGQIVLLLAGAFGVVILFKDRRMKERKK